MADRCRRYGPYILPGFPLPAASPLPIYFRIGRVGNKNPPPSVTPAVGPLAWSRQGMAEVYGSRGLLSGTLARRSEPIEPLSHGPTDTATARGRPCPTRSQRRRARGHIAFPAKEVKHVAEVSDFRGPRTDPVPGRGAGAIRRG